MICKYFVEYVNNIPVIITVIWTLESDYEPAHSESHDLNDTLNDLILTNKKAR